MIYDKIEIKPPAKIHLIGICGTGMGALAGLLKLKGYDVTGSDANPYPPMSDELEQLKIPVFEGYKKSNIKSDYDLVVVGNVCRKDHVEVLAAQKANLKLVSMPQVLRDIFIEGNRSIVVAGTHGKTTTTSLISYLLDKCGQDPSVMIGGVTKDFGCGYKLGKGDCIVLEGDEYDSAYFQKVAKFMSYAPNTAVLTSVEHDHIDIYPTQKEYFEAFEAFVELINDGPLVAYTGDPGVQKILDNAELNCQVISYGIKGDPCNYEPAFLAHPKSNDEFELFVEGLKIGRFKAPMTGRHNMRNILAAIVIANRFCKISFDDIKQALPDFGGVARRQQLLGTPGGVNVYDDFAHHPTAVEHTIKALRKKHTKGKLIVAFEPRSATASRKIHQSRYAMAFGKADIAIIAPVGREIAEDEILDTNLLAQSISKRGTLAFAAQAIEHVQSLITSNCSSGDTIVLFSNGSFGGLHKSLIQTLE